jgi:hypothetical protein
MPSPFVGTWQLVSQQTLYPDGTTVPSRGENAMGVIMYDQAGNMAVQLMRTDEHATDYTDMTDLKSAMAGFLSYFGRYEVDEEQHKVQHHILGASYFGYRGTTQTRTYEFSGNELILQAQSPLDNSTRVLRWRRAEGNA